MDGPYPDRNYMPMIFKKSCGHFWSVKKKLSELRYTRTSTCFSVPIQIVNGLYCVLACYLLTRRQESNSSSLAVLTYFSEDSSVEKTRAIKGAMPVTTNSSHQPLIWSVWKFLCHTSYSMALFPSFWLFPLMNCI